MLPCTVSFSLPTSVVPANATITAPWNNYQLNTAYQMETPALPHGKGVGRVAFNPYLETSLCSNPESKPVQHCGKSSWFGVSTNCMSCHRMAAWKSVTYDSAGITKTRIDGPPYMPAMYINAGDTTYFKGYAKADFLWSVAIRTAHVPKPSKK